MPTPTHAAQMVAKYEAALLAVPAGATTVTIDGVTVALGDLEAKLAYWQRRAAAETNRRPPLANVRLG